MTNKIPEIRKIYRNIDNGREINISSFGIQDVLFRYRDSLYEFGNEKESREKFSERFEELPDQEPTTEESSTPLEKPSKEDHIVDANKKVKSIWKPISELPKFCCDVVIKFTEDDICFATFSDDTNQFFMISETKGVVCISPPMEYARLTDFINQQASLEERITKLENK